MADHFSAISNTVEPLDSGQFHPVLRLAVEEGRNSSAKPILTQQQVYQMLKKVKKPKSSVEGDVPRKIISEFSYEYAKPATMIYNRIIQSCKWPKQWKVGLSGARGCRDGANACVEQKHLFYMPLRGYP